MNTTLLRKHWMELRGLWIFAIFATALPAILLTSIHSGHTAIPTQPFIFMFALIMVVIPPRFAGTGLGTSRGIIVQRGEDPSIFFTLSLPASRRTLFFYRAAFALCVLEVAASLGLLVGSAVFVHIGGSWQVVSQCFWVLLGVVPVYFLDCLLSIRIKEANIVFAHFGFVLALGFLLPMLGMNIFTFPATLSGVPLFPFALVALVLAAMLAAATVWALDRQDY